MTEFADWCEIIAGLPMEQVAGSKTSCFMGAFMRDYDGVLLAKDANKPGQYKATGNGNSVISNRVVSTSRVPASVPVTRELNGMP